MAILKIARMGHPALRRVAEPVADLRDPDLARLVRDMVETMDDAGGVGLAAPQVHDSRRVIVFRLPEARVTGAPGDEADGVQVLINPVVEPLGDDVESGWEGCLSIPGLRGDAPRWARIRYRGFDADGSPVAREASGFHARVVQHEVDHLDGVLYLDRMRDLARLAFLEEMRHFQNGAAR